VHADRKRHLLRLKAAQPDAQVVAIGRRDATAADLAALGVQIVERDLATVKIQTTNDAHDQPPSEDDNDPPIGHLPPDFAVPPHAIFFTVDTVWLRRLYVLVFLSIGSRRVEYVACTGNSNTAWMLQQARNLLMERDDRQR
jgi:hypothetical protein